LQITDFVFLGSFFLCHCYRFFLLVCVASVTPKSN